MTNGSIAPREKEMFDMNREGTNLLKSLSHGTYFISVKISWFRRIIADAMRHVHDFYLARVDDELTKVILLGVIRQRTYCIDSMIREWKIESTGIQHVSFSV